MADVHVYDKGLRAHHLYGQDANDVVQLVVVAVVANVAGDVGGTERELSPASRVPRNGHEVGGSGATP